MPPSDIPDALVHLFSELVTGAPPGGNTFILNSSDVGLLRSLDALTPEEASASVNGGASAAAHVTHLAYGLGLMNRWASEGGNPFANASWDDAWKVSGVDTAQWKSLRESLGAEAIRWQAALGSTRSVTSVELRGMIASVAHLAYHLGAIRQIATKSRGPREGTFR